MSTFFEASPADLVPPEVLDSRSPEVTSEKTECIPSVSDGEDVSNEEDENDYSEYDVPNDCADATIAEALQGLSLQEREQVYWDQHGVPDAIERFEKDEALRQTKLEKLEGYLQTFMASKRVQTQAYERARHENPDWVLSTKFQLRFLYAELFRARKAASRMIRYFQYKEQVFGNDRLAHPIRMTDLSPKDLTELRTGQVQVLPRRDTAGRLILVVVMRQGTLDAKESMARIVFLMDSPVDESIESKGIVLVVYHLGKFQFRAGDRQGIYFGSRAMSDLSTRIAAIHNCVSDPRHRAMVNIAMRFNSREVRAKHKLHYGNFNECMYALMTYGIPISLLPVSSDGTIKRKFHLEVLQRRQILEEYRQSNVQQEYVDFPTNTDVLLGRGRPIQDHRGNQTLQQRIDDLLPKYDGLSDIEKRDLTLQVVQEMEGRFLTQESGVWMQVSNDLAREKVSHLFRNRRKQAVRLAKLKQSVNGSAQAPKRVRVG